MLSGHIQSKNLETPSSPIAVRAVAYNSLQASIFLLRNNFLRRQLDRKDIQKESFVFDRQYLVVSLFYAVMGLLMGIYMASAKDHSLMVVHAHMMLLGFVVSFIYAVIYKNWLPRASGPVAIAQFCLHQVCALAMIVGLFLLYSRMVPEPVVGPVLGVSSIGVLLGLVLMVVMVLKEKPVRAANYIAG